MNAVVSAQVDAVYFPQVEVVGDVANSIWRLTQALSRRRIGTSGVSTRSASTCWRTWPVTRTTRDNAYGMIKWKQAGGRQFPSPDPLKRLRPLCGHRSAT
jgi:hypothetical protein